MTEQFGFWVACVVLIAVVAGGCDERNDFEDEKWEAAKTAWDMSVDRDKREFRDFHDQIHAEDDHENRRRAECEKAFGKGWMPGSETGYKLRDGLSYITDRTCVFSDEKILPSQLEAAK